MSEGDVWNEESLEDEGPALPRRAVEDSADMDITPMIDITFLLLIFFLVCSTMSQATSVKLPPARHGKGVDEQTAVIITIDGEEGEGKPRVYLGDGTTNPFKSWLVFEVLGLVIGGFISGAIAGRNKIMVEKGPRISNKGRFLFAFIGGALMGYGAKLARGCTSGQALSGGAVLSVGGWAFMAAVFAGAYAFAYFLRRQWL